MLRNYAIAFAATYGAYRVIKALLPGSHMDLAGKMVLVTGAASGVGRELAKELAGKGCSLALVDIQMDALEETERIVRETCLQPGQTVELYSCNLARRASVYQMAQKVLSDTAARGGVDVVINNAGIVTGAPFFDSDDEKNELTMQVNCLSHMWMAKAFVPPMIQRKSGNFVTIVSIASRLAAPSMVDYACSKAAALSFSEGLHLELQRMHAEGVHVTCICPTHINTSMFKGFDAHGGSKNIGITLSRHGVAKSTVAAIEANEQLVWLPGTLRPLLLLKAFNEMRNVLGMQTSFKSSHDPMKNWDDEHTKSVWNKVRSSL